VTDKTLLKHFRQTVRGWLNEEESHLLYDMAQVAKRPIFEIGTFQGLSTLCLAAGSYAGGQQLVFTVDPHNTQDTIGCQKHEFEMEDAFHAARNFALNECGRLICPMIAHDADVVNLFAAYSFDLLFIDGCHKRQSVVDNIQRWYAKVAYGGTILFHDTCFQSVREAIDICHLSIDEVIGTIGVHKKGGGKLWNTTTCLV
jgi:predicted O-methyltransferase YrrM